MIDKNLLAALAADHRKNRLTREEARAFLKDLMEVCDKHRVFLRIHPRFQSGEQPLH